MKKKENEEEVSMNATVESEKITVMSDIHKIIQKAMKEQNLDPEEVIKKLGASQNGK